MRSITGTPSSSSRLRSWRGSSSSSTATRLASASFTACFSSVELAAAEVAVGIGALAALDHLAGHRHAGGAQQLAELGEIQVAGSDTDRQTRAERARRVIAVWGLLHRSPV